MLGQCWEGNANAHTGVDSALAEVVAIAFGPVENAFRVLDTAIFITLLVAGIECLARSQGGRIYFGLQSHGPEPNTTGSVRRLVTLCSESGSRERDGLVFRSFPPLHSVLGPQHTYSVSLTFRVCLPSSAKPLWKHLPKHSQRSVSMVILNPIKLTMRINLHSHHRHRSTTERCSP